MKERPILMSAPMVLATLAGSKRQTRRTQGLDVVNQRPDAWKLHRIAPLDVYSKPQFKGRFGAYFHSEVGAIEANVLSVCPVVCPYGAPGDRLWVRETWYDDFQRAPGEAHELNIERFDDGRVEGIEYRASHDGASFEAGCPCNPDGDGKRSEWRPSLYMPRWASRITLEITKVRAQRLQDITDEDARAEGLPLPPGPAIVNGQKATLAVFNPKFALRLLWDQINGQRAGCSWGENPWAWCVSFKRISAELQGAEAG